MRFRRCLCRSLERQRIFFIPADGGSESGGFHRNIHQSDLLLLTDVIEELCVKCIKIVYFFFFLSFGSLVRAAFNHSESVRFMLRSSMKMDVSENGADFLLLPSDTPTHRVVQCHTASFTPSLSLKDDHRWWKSEVCSGTSCTSTLWLFKVCPGAPSVALDVFIPGQGEWDVCFDAVQFIPGSFFL